MNQVNSNGASKTVFEHSDPNEVKQSRFDLSRIINATIDVGGIYPIDCFKVYPGDNVSVDNELQLDTLPLVQSSLTQYKLVAHTYYSKARDLWKGAKTQVTKGRTGNVNLSTPHINPDLPLVEDIYYKPSDGKFYSGSGTGRLKGNIYAKGSHSLYSFIGVPTDYQGLYGSTDDSSSDFYIVNAYLPYVFVATGNDTRSVAYNKACSSGFNQYSRVNALPFVMYQSIVKNNYVPQNLLQGNESLFPEPGDDDWLLPYNASTTNFIDYASNDSFDPSADIYDYSGVFTSFDTVTRLDQLRYCLFEDDYFTTSLPWLQRGDTEFINLSTSGTLPVMFGANGNEYYLNLFAYKPNIENIGISGGVEPGSIPGTSDSVFYMLLNSNGGGNGTQSLNRDQDVDIYPLYSSIQPGLVTTSLSANQLRSLIAMSVFQERNAKVNGSYNAMIYQHWRVNPHSEEHQPLYIGGSAEFINFSTVIQNSASTSSSPLGSTAGFGSTAGQSTINHSFSVPDYGYIMTVIMVKPVTYYQQGVEHFLCAEDSFEDLIQPEFQGLSPEPIYNKELFVSGDDSIDDDLFGYQERFTYAKVRQNVNRGLFQVAPNFDRLFASFTQARWFTELPNLSYQFVVCSPDNLRRDWLAYPSYPAFRLQYLSKVFVTRRLSYQSQPETFGF